MFSGRLRLTTLPRRRLLPALASALLAALLASGCNYSLVRYRNASDVAPRVYLQTLENDTPEAGLELLVSDALRREVLRRGGMRLVAESAAADYRVGGRVANLEIVSRSFSSTVRALEYTLVVSLDLDVSQRDGTRIPLDYQVQTGTELYLASADVEAGRKNREESLRRISDVLAARIVDALDQVAFP